MRKCIARNNFRFIDIITHSMTNLPQDVQHRLPSDGITTALMYFPYSLCIQFTYAIGNVNMFIYFKKTNKNITVWNWQEKVGYQAFFNWQWSYDIPFCMIQLFSKLYIIIFINRTIYCTCHIVYLLHPMISKRMIWMIGLKLLQHQKESILTVTSSIAQISLEPLAKNCMPGLQRHRAKSFL